jgi:hypothetical protein
MKTLYKRLLSYFKSDWNLDDYPIRYREQKVENFRNLNDFKKWSVQIINWWVMGGLGKTKSEAFLDLKANFESYKKEKELPRPGVKVPIEFVPSNKIDTYQDIAVEFFDKILDLNFYNCFISNQSCLGHFTFERLVDFDKKINDYYNLDIKNSEEYLFTELFELIYKKKGDYSLKPNFERNKEHHYIPAAI